MDMQQVFTYLFGAIVVLVPLFALYKCLVNGQIKKTAKVLWMLGIIIIPVFGGLVYLFMNEAKVDQ
ncbi:PLDc N-terminal domain-containing protein [Sphingobacterium yanglingense]|uniref:Phospholipase D-like protein n=1 Tax=Sphingobacterium yanglingense TaxID=1437280 RepID=A0A4R6W801_9SPHI|nr:PLDc N-terminal domain-containing protein [Sphingobacterium yanglingense]TDQ73541.1 phospholipase D-like protein [Sphingobacterium yanglingense]